jgi:hypothetical protein
MSNTKPFDPDPPKPVDPIAEAKLVLRTRFEKVRAAERAQFESDAESAYAKHLADERAAWIRSWKRDNALRATEDPYQSLTDAEILRIASDPDERIPKLFEGFTATRAIDFLTEATKVFLYRRTSRATLQEIRDFLKHYIEVHGPEEIYTEHVTEHQVLDSPVGRSTTGYRTNRVVIASGLSTELKAVLRSLTVQGGTVLFATRSEIIDSPGRVGERLTLAHNDDNYPAEEW